MTWRWRVGGAGVLLAGLFGVIALWRPPSAPAWRLVLDRPVRGKYEDLAFPTADQGWVIAAAGEILHTADGGATWTVQAQGLGHLRSLELLDTRRGFAGTLGGVLYRTDDGGEHWSDVTATLPVPPRGFCGMDHHGEEVHLVGRFAGAVSDHYHSTDGGRTWSYQDLSAHAGGLVDVLFLDTATGFIGGRSTNATPGLGGPLILKTDDGGVTWREVFELGGGHGFAWKLFPTSPDTLYAALQTEDGVLRIARSTDAGETWEVRLLDEGKREAPGLQSVGFLDADHGWAGGFFAGMYETDDAGTTWHRLASPDRNINRFVRGAGGLVTASSRGVLVLSAPGGAAARGPARSGR